ncbi:hypothetical protein [Acinetobacter lactucae]|uniref:Uncharacterized protein n=1 Tax=Acinetobacter lactucae TaxID=1785128 RepID=R8YW78_9GAMM|nr:hypothetical protein [Acinetobacter lactucae]ARD28365.1 hypothetical protein OTEC02_06020 [Acinetobacter lactucae]EOQ73356.1 hypothetical protein F929_03295 [Acinetobacter lactucae]ETR94212.1 hypothetical protein M211_2486 [Acinetobacter lactucae]MDD9317692.1 hypothetical protein [Acinetobacter lactucae]MDD9321820.1 hypothetical protein [Acinetobacter lactucae]
MIGQQRNILATLGIDVWIPKTQVCQKNNAQSLWRDHAAEEGEPIILPSKNDLVLEQPTKPQVNEIPKVEPEIVAQLSVEVTPVVPPRIEVQASAVTIASFELQAFALEKCVIFLDVTNLADEEKQLWSNIQKAKIGQYAELKWPFPLASYQDQRGAGSYIQGFLDAVAADKKILCLGECSYIQHANIIHLASLKEMLEKPLLKKRLWQLMQDNNE